MGILLEVMKRSGLIEAFSVDCDRLVRFIHVGKADPRILHVLVAALSWFKGKDSNRMHLFPLVNETKSGVRIQVWLGRLAVLLQADGKSLFTPCSVMRRIIS